MSGLEVIGLVISAIPIVTRVVKHFGTQRNAPRQVERLSRMLAELRDVRLVEAAMPAEQKHIHEMVNRCTDLLEKENATTSQKGRTWNFFWSTEIENRLKVHNDELERELDRLHHRVHMWNALSTTPPPTLLSPPGSPPSSPPDLGGKEIGAREFTRPVSVPAPVSPLLPSSRRASVEGLHLPATLCLQNPYGKRIGEKLKLQTLTIIERDDMWRRIQYVGRDAAGAEVRLTHRIPRGNIWFEDEDLEDVSVSFLQAHDITVQNSEGYKVYRSYSLYQFGTVEHRETFLVHVRERELLGRYFAEKIWEKGELIAQQKVVRLWKKTVRGESQKTTLSFIGRDEKPYERPLVDFSRSPTLRENRVDLVAGSYKTTLEFRRPPSQPKQRSGLFGRRSKTSTSSISEGGANDSDAARFKATFEESHPATSTFKPLTWTPTVLEPMADFEDPAATSPRLPGLTPSTSRAPTLSTMSIPSASLYFPSDDPRISPRSSVATKEELSYR